MFKKEFEYGFAIFSKEQLDPTDAIYSKVENKSKYRYYYHLDICPKRTLLYIMVNPSTADDYDMDTTMRNCMSLASKYNFNAISVVNLFPERATKFKLCEPCKAHDVNIEMLNKAIQEHTDIVLAWGSYEKYGIGKVKLVEGKNYYYIVPKGFPIKSYHPSNLSWNRYYGGFDNATLYKIDFIF
jgi:hypothetical protein